MGLIGGMSWVSTAHYYRRIHQLLAEKGSGKTPSLLISSVDFERLARLQEQGRWDEVLQMITEHASKLRQAGCRSLALCSNTIHIIASELQKSLSVPLLDIRQACTDQLKAQQVSSILLMGTAFTLEEGFFMDYLENEGIQTCIPDKEDIDMINQLIFSELVVGQISQASKRQLHILMQKYEKAGHMHILSACTELYVPLLETKTSIHLWDSLELHCRQIAQKID